MHTRIDATFSPQTDDDADGTGICVNVLLPLTIVPKHLFCSFVLTKAGS